MYSTKAFTFSMEEMSNLWKPSSWSNSTTWTPAGYDLYFLGTLYDFYYLESLTGTGVTHVIKDGIQLKILGRNVRTFKPGVPFNIQV